MQARVTGTRSELKKNYFHSFSLKCDIFRSKIEQEHQFKGTCAARKVRLNKLEALLDLGDETDVCRTSRRVTVITKGSRDDADVEISIAKTKV